MAGLSGIPAIGGAGLFVPGGAGGAWPGFPMIPSQFQSLLTGYDSAPVPTIYVDTVGGSDSNNGLISSAPKQTFGAAVTLAGSQGPGACIGIKCGSTVVGPIFIDSISGNADAPIWVRPYGAGAAPVFSWTADAGFNLYGDLSGIYFRDGSSYWTFDGGKANGLKFSGAKEGGAICNGADTGRAAGGHFKFYNCEFTDLGLGVALDDPVGHSIVKRCYFHDGHMVVDTAGGNDDYGANGIRVAGGTGNVIAFNFAENLKASSHDYTVDGGFVEFYVTGAGSPVGGCEVAYNLVINSMGFCEGGGNGVQSGGTYVCSISNVRIHHNISLNNEKFFTFHRSGGFGCEYSGCKFQHNTVIQTAAHISGGNYAYGASYDDTNVVIGEWEMSGNLFFIDQRATTQDFLAIYESGMDTAPAKDASWHHDNAYFVPAGSGPTSYTIPGGQSGLHIWTNWGEGLNASEVRRLMTDPCFANLVGGDFSIAEGSEAAGFGAI